MLFISLCFSSCFIFAQISVGSGSYTTTHPGTDAAGRNGFPSGTPFVTGNADNRPIPTNDWWSKLIKEGQADNLFNYPLTLKTTSEGLIMTYIPWGVIGDSQPIKVGLSGLNVDHTKVSDFSDWTVSMSWEGPEKEMKATAGIGMPFVYFEKGNNDEVEITVQSGEVTIREEQLIIENAASGADFVVYAPVGSTWTSNGATYRSNCNGKTYWSIAMLPQGSQNVEQRATDFAAHAYVFPTNTAVTWDYDSPTGKVETTFTITTEVKEGNSTAFLQGLLPHQWSHLAAQSPQPSALSFTTVRGEMKLLKGNTFVVENNYAGILPTLPNLTQYSETYDPAALKAKIQLLENSQLDSWTDSYNEGQLMNRLIQTARAANEIGLVESRDKIVSTIKERLENWLTYTAGEKAFLFYYNEDWTSLIGYPAGHGQDTNINDHHFHWGYFIHAAAFLEQFQPGWVEQWGPMINLLIRDAATQNRDDQLFPFLRNFSPYAGHSWANGFASFPQGNDQESTSESMQFNTSLIHYGTVTGQEDIRDLGIYLYTTEQSAIEEYWFDTEERNFQANQNYGLVSRVWGNSYDNGTFWTSDITASYGIEFYPIHGGSFYLANDQEYASRIWSEIEQNTEILNPNSQNPNLWYDTFWKYLAFTNPSKALELYDNSPNRTLKFGVSDAHTYYWLHNLESLGIFQSSIHADYPIAAVFEKEGTKTYVAHNYGASTKNITFSDGYTLEALPNQMTTSRDSSVSGVLETDFLKAYPNSTVELRLSATEGDLAQVVFYREGTAIATDTTSPYTINSDALPIGNQDFWARIYSAEGNFQLSNILTIQVGEQQPYNGEYHSLPGTIDAGHYDTFEGGKGQNITYLDLTSGNNADFRTDEDVDAGEVANEGATVGWIDAGEWLAYSIDVEQSGRYSFSFRYASGNATGGGPFYIEIDEEKISPNITVNSTSNENWDTWQTKTIQPIELTEGKHIMRVYFTNGGFNLGQMTFSRVGDLSYTNPTAEAGENRTVLLPATTTQLDGSASTSNGAGQLTYHWEQLYGPSRVVFDNENSPTPQLSNLVEGVYRIQLAVTAGEKTAKDQLYLIVNTTGNHPPSVRLERPENNTTFRENQDIVMEATASDLDGEVARVLFYQGNQQLAERNQAPYHYTWENVPNGSYTLTAKAIDNNGAETISSPRNVVVEEVIACTQTHSSGQQGQFSTGYRTTFETVGSTVNITFELLDTDKNGVVAWLWQESPFQELEMTQEGARVFKRTISGLETGQSVSFACKFAYAGGMSVTNYIGYVVGSDCSGEAATAPDDTEEEEEEEETPTVANSICSGQSTEASQGNFSSGFRYEFTPTSNGLSIEFELLDNQNGVIAYLWRDQPFSETSMNAIGDRRFSTALTGVNPGEIVRFACKFAYAGGMVVTKYFSFTIGQNCGQTSANDADGDGVWNDDDQCPGTAAGAVVNENGCENFYLPSTNFRLSKTEQCRDSNSIQIVAVETSYTYNVAIRGALTLNDSFTEGQFNLDHLSAGNYTICLTVEGVPASEFERCFDLTIEAIQPLNVFSVNGKENETLHFNLSGGKVYTITHNNKTIRTSDSQYTLNLVEGNNHIEIATDLACQGVFSQSYFNSPGITLAPNPIDETLFVYVGGEDDKVTISIYTNDGKVIASSSYPVDSSRTVPIDVGELDQGSYIIKALGESINTSEVMIKK